ncbi:WD40 repeat-like protein [Suillus hirtellus]|nr:WD40 repeat-like protein [Suillus hirtellus]
MAVTTHKVSTKAPAQLVELTLKGHEEAVYGVTFIPGTRLLVTGSTDKSLWMWDLDTGKQVGELLLGHGAQVWAVSASHDGRWIVSGGGNGSILVWEVATNKRELKRVPVLCKGHENAVQGVVFAPDNKTFASASEDKTVCVWKRETGKIALGPLRVGGDAFVNSVSYSPDGAKLAAGREAHHYLEFSKWRNGLRLVSGNLRDIRISDATTGDIIKQFDAHITESFLSLAIGSNGTKLATTSHDKTTRFFDLTTFEPIGELLEHPAAVWCVAFSEDSKLITTGCQDGHSTQKIVKKTIPDPRLRPKCTPIATNRFFDDFDPTGRNNRAGITRNAKGSKIKNMIHRIFSRSSASQDQILRPRGVPLVDVSATRGKYRTANAHSGKRDKLLRIQRPPRNWQGHAGASSSSTPPAGTSHVVNETGPATLQTGGTRPSSPLDVAPAPYGSCFAVLARCLPCSSRSTSGFR